MMIDDFKARFVEFKSTDIDAIFSVLESSFAFYYGGSYEESPEIILQLLAHLFVNETMMNKTMGGVVEEDTEDAFFQTTKYGQRFLQLIQHDHGGRPV